MLVCLLVSCFVANHVGDVTVFVGFFSRQCVAWFPVADVVLHITRRYVSMIVLWPLVTCHSEYFFRERNNY